MKIKKTNIKHWISLFNMGVIALIAAILRIFIYKPNNVLFYGHKLNGNLLPIFDKYLLIGNTYYGTIDFDYFKSLSIGTNPIINLCSFKSIILLAKTKIIVTSHGLHSLIFFKFLTTTKFVDVWHGIPFKGFDGKDFKVQHTYDEVWVTSEKLKQIYIDVFSFPSKIVFSTGYARTDILITPPKKSLIKEKYGIPKTTDKIILFCPTWNQDLNVRNLFPFDTSAEIFFGMANEICRELNACFVFRTHLNTKFKEMSPFPSNTVFLPADTYPHTEEILTMGDILVCDWSSIAFDYLLLKRPTLFLDIPPPFKKTLSLDESYRFGEIVSTINDLFKMLKLYLNSPDIYYNIHVEKIERITSELYDSNADGQASERCAKRLCNLNK